MSYYSINWKHEVIEYKSQYDDDDHISEYIESMLPPYYGEIYTTYHEALGTPFNIEIESHHVGLTLDKILLQNLFNEYYDQFMMALHVYEELGQEEE
jgi:hypothetical protein|tara:strand:- start:5011 stop:5301 length:291 start_codon:yes stop_codon:yes gene_type:complete